jgi:dienelactone hydrolase
LIVGTCTIYLCNYYHADKGAIAAFSADENIITFTDENGNVIFKPQNARCGIIFYPGGKVEHNAYQPLMAQLAREGIFCVLVKMPFNLAVFDINAANGIQSQYHEIENWYIGGHSLGGSMAASYISDHIEEYKGLILLGSYSAADISKSNLDVLSIYGSEDRVLNIEKYDKNKSNLPDDVIEFIIEGGCHAYFGMYGAQDGDGEPTISNTEQIDITVENIVKMLNGES